MEITPELREKAILVMERLVDKHGPFEFKPRREGMHELISTMLSHRTTEANEAKAYHQMRAWFGTWEAVRDAPLNKLVAAIRPATFAEQKAPRIQEAVRRVIDERGDGNIDFLEIIPTDEAMAWLTDMPGVGVKTASLVLLFCYGKPVLPVDTHVHRVSQRTGLIGEQVNAQAAHGILLEMLGDDPPILFDFHMALLRHGQKVCHWSDPKCGQCPVRNMCEWYEENAKVD